MKRTAYRLSLIAGLLLTAYCLPLTAQTQIQRPCPASSARAKVDISAAGRVTLRPCATQTVRIDNPAGTSTFPFIFTPTTAGGSLTFGNAASSYFIMGQGGGGSATLRAFGTLGLDTGSAGVGYFGDVSGTGPKIGISSGGIDIDSKATSVIIGDKLAVGNGTKITLDDANQDIILSTGTTLNVGTSGQVAFGAGSGLGLDRTITAIGTTGNQTINKMAGTINVAPGVAAVTLTNSLITATSIIFTTIRTNDTTCQYVDSVVPGAGSAVITVNANCAAATSIGFLVTN